MLPRDQQRVIDIVRAHPDTILALVRAAYGMRHPRAIDANVVIENPSETPLGNRDHVVLVLRNPGEARPIAALVVDVQLQPDARKHLAWPVFVALEYARLRCPVTLVVIALDVHTARWSATPIELDDNGSVLRPLVIGPPQVPRVDVEASRRHPELAALSRIAHEQDTKAAPHARLGQHRCPS